MPRPKVFGPSRSTRGHKWHWTLILAGCLLGFTVADYANRQVNHTFSKLTTEQVEEELQRIKDGPLGENVLSQVSALAGLAICHLKTLSKREDEIGRLSRIYIQALRKSLDED